MIKLITAISKRISLFLYKNNVIDSEDIEIYMYGFEIIVSTIFATLIILAIGILLRMVALSILYLIIFSSLRQMTGGYHADTYFKCNLSFGIISFCILVLTRILSQDHVYSLNIHLLFLLFSTLVIIVYAPVENPNKPLDEKQKRKNHICSILSAIILSAVSCACFTCNYSASILIGLTLFIVAMLILIVKMKRKGEEK
ncbi:MAG: hypothetical protein E7504_07950 [Ruminococcus sp.]|nr:hypothetical protein [Ruminococcus sp.]